MSNVVQLPVRKRGDEFTAKKLGWIEAVALDTTISAEAARLATVLAVKFMSRRSGCAFPSQKTLGDILGIKERQVRRHMSALVSAGYIVQNHRGRNRSNEYKIAFGTGHQKTGDAERDWSSEGRWTGHPATGPGPVIPRPPNPLSQPNESNPLRRRPSAADPIEVQTTLEVSRGSRLEGAPPSPAEKNQPVTFRVGESRKNSRGQEYEVTAVDDDRRTVTVKFAEDGRVATVPAPEGAVLEPAGPRDELDDEMPM